MPQQMFRIGFVFAFCALCIQAESLRYVIKWPSGLNLGEASLNSSGLTFTFEVDASLPAYTIHDRYTSSTTAQLCTVRFERETQHGSKKTNERIVIAADGKIKRETVNGGSTEIPASSCAHDALALLFATRLSLQQGKLPAAQTVLFGSGYPVRFENSGTENITVSDKPALADKVTCILTLPKSGDYRIEMYFLRDLTRTPALVRAPFALGTFTLELVR